MDVLAKTTQANRLREAGSFDEAIHLHIEVLRVCPEVDIVWLNLGACLENRGWLLWAERAYRRALALSPERHEAAVNLALLLFKTGRYQEGFQHYLRRWGCAGWPQKWAETGLPRWQGEPLAGQTVLVLPDQGFGDCIQAARFCHWLKESTASRVVLQARPPLLRLFAESDLADVVVPVGEVPPGCDKVVSQWDIPSQLPWSEQAFQPATFLSVPEARRQEWQQRLAPLTRSRIGIVWRGNPVMVEDRWRSIPLAAWQSVLAVPKIDFLSLQKDATSAELDELAGYDLHHQAGTLLSDFAETAACLVNLDLLITVDTAVAHVAAGLGLPVWLLLYKQGDWRWGQQGERCDWYPSVRVFRQTRLGEWAAVMAQVVAALPAALANRPERPIAVTAAHLSNAGVHQFRAGRAAAALAAMQRAVALPDAQAEHFGNLAYVLKRLERFAESLQALAAGIERFPNDAALRWHRSLLLLLLGRFAEALPDYEYRWQVPDFPSRLRVHDCPQWQGQADSAGTLLIHAEQGFGDTIQFVRYVHLAAARVGRVVLEVPPELLRLLQHQQDEPQGCLPAKVLLKGLDLIPSPASWHCPLMSLPLALGMVALDHPPLPEAYLRVPPGMVVHRDSNGWPRLAVGIVWAGRPSHAQDAERSFGLAALSAVTTLPGVQWFCLQQGFDDSALADWPGAIKPMNLSPYLTDFMNTAQILRGLDLVITADTAVAHLAAALGVTTWIPLMKIPDWRWGLAGSTTPWYDKVTLFRQSCRGEWGDVFNRIAEALSKRITEKNHV